MNSIEVVGGTSLVGEISIQGSKNAALPMLAATILNRGAVILHNCPKIIDVLYMLKILEYIGCEVKWEGSTVTIDATNLTSYDIPEEYANKMRSSVILSGALLSRMKKAIIPFPGGCAIGNRPIDVHLSAFRDMNVTILEKDNKFVLETEELIANTIIMKISSVGATENAILASVCTNGTTKIVHAAKEPEIIELARLLVCMGADIAGAGTDEITIHGVEKLHEAEFTIMSDRIATGTYILATMGTYGNICITNPPIKQLTILLDLVRQMGGQYKMTEKGLMIDARGATLSSIPYIETKPYPGFPTDLQSQLIAVLSVAKGVSVVCESIFEARFKAALELKKLGADITITGKEIKVTGVSKLKGTKVEAEELRGGAALVIAGLMASGTTCVYNTQFIKRGYENICKDLQGLGANIYEKQEIQEKNDHIR